MRIPASCILLAAAMLLTGCAHGPSPADRARESCEGLLNDDNSSEPEQDGITVEETAELAESLDRRADLAAEAAVGDARWNRLADSFSWLAEAVTSTEQQARQNGSENVTSDDPETTRLHMSYVQSDCRKARVA